MKYNFRIIESKDTLKGDIILSPLLEIENSQRYGWFFSDELNNLSTDIEYVAVIVDNLEKLVDCKLEFYNDFGYEVYVIECNQKEALVKNIYEEDKVEAIIPIIDIYTLMKDWLFFLIDFKAKEKI
ncbi:hypothetical protein [Myroides profundi]|uniref:Uncharacterized protein n=1 Tax=Myroides profundi TaxID=480520 RepID=A0AAJ5BEJ8_MYRPR|nr:hypothetical protein [Myroides profundi]AJH14371.1 hypothetical protein MPR_1187 [Myroides profundi]SER17158.1 hypothetical protein SAMN04488089_11074 [Myroides profundi]